MPLKVMVVDDSMFMRNIIKNVVTGSGHQVVAECEDGQQAINKYPEIKPDLVFMDIMMPNVGGLDALKAIRQSDGNARIVMCTSVGQEKIVDEAIDSGALDFILKPFKPEDIKEVLGKLAQ